jgi:hypothetical protein
LFRTWPVTKQEMPKVKFRSPSQFHAGLSVFAGVKQLQIGTEMGLFRAFWLGIEPDEALADAGAIQAAYTPLGVSGASTQPSQLGIVHALPLHHIMHALGLPLHVAADGPIHGRSPDECGPLAGPLKADL